MAKLLIEADVTGLNNVKQLEGAVSDLGKTTESVSTKTIALGNIYAQVATKAVEAFFKVGKAGYDYQKRLDAISGATNTLSQNTDNISESFGQLSASIFNTADQNSAWNTILKATDGLMLELSSIITGKTVPALVAEQEALINAEEAQKTKNETDREAIKLAKEQATEQERINKLMQEGYQNAFQWRQAGFEEVQRKALKDLTAQKRLDAEATREQTRAYEAQVDALKEINDALLSRGLTGEGKAIRGDAGETQFYAELGNELSRLGAQGATDAQLMAIYNADVKDFKDEQKNTTEAVKNNTINNTNYNNATIGGSASSSASDDTPATYRMAYSSRNWVTGNVGSLTGGSQLGRTGGRKYRTVVGGSFTGTLQAPEVNEDTSAERLKIAQALGEQKRYAEALAKVTQELEDAEAELEKWSKFLEESIAILDGVNDGLKDMVNTLESISNALSENYYERARESLYGGTGGNELKYDEAKALADSAWDVYQSDTWNEEYLATYNDRMDDLIGTLDDFNNTALYTSKQEQDWAKAVALYEIGQMQEVQDEQKSDIDRQIELLEQMVAISEMQEEAQEEANRILDLVEQETKAGTDATYLVQDAVDDVEYATEQVKIANDEIEQKRTEKFNLENTRWTQTGQTTYQVWTGESSGVGQKVYETVTEPTFGYVTESGEQIGFRSGGYTGNDSINNVAGLVHGQEYVLNAETTSALGLNDTSSTGVFGTMAERLTAIEMMIYEQLKTDKRNLAINVDSRNIIEERL